jgi:hypothetical protein
MEDFLLFAAVGFLAQAIDGALGMAYGVISSTVLLTFGVAGIALFVASWLIVRGGRFPRGLGYVGYVSAILLLALYLGRLIVLDPTSPVILIPALLNGFLANPLFYIWLGLTLLRRRGT